jgi:hypothetical protein
MARALLRGLAMAAPCGAADVANDPVTAALRKCRSPGVIGVRAPMARTILRGVALGMTPTAGGVLLTGDGGGTFLVFDARTGKILYRFDTGGGIAGGITTYSAAGRQYIAVPSGNAARGTWQTTGSATLLVFGLGAHVSK